MPVKKKSGKTVLALTEQNISLTKLLNSYANKNSMLERVLEDKEQELNSVMQKNRELLICINNAKVAVKSIINTKYPGELIDVYKNITTFLQITYDTSIENGVSVSTLRYDEGEQREINSLNVINRILHSK